MIMMKLRPGLSKSAVPTNVSAQNTELLTRDRPYLIEKERPFARAVLWGNRLSGQ